jgi:hypothetical protein
MDENQPQTVELPLIDQSPELFAPSIRVVPIEGLPKVQPHHIRQVVIVTPRPDDPGFLMELRDHDGEVIHDMVGSAQNIEQVLTWLGEVFRDLLE